jgi:hypothetical protein
MVALCIVAIFTTIAVPGFKKTMQDLKLNEFACNFDSLIKAFRSYYLIFNEWPADGGDNVVPSGKIRYFLQHHLYSGNQFIYRPLRKSGTAFDFENWILNDGRVMSTVGLTARGLGNNFQLGWGKLQLSGDHKNHFFNVKDLVLTQNSDIFYRFPDIPQTNNENRYY